MLNPQDAGTANSATVALFPAKGNLRIQVLAMAGKLPGY
jgi:hypothetical protein